MKVAVVGSGDMGGAIASKAALSHAVSVRGSRIGSPSVTAIVKDSKGRISEASDDDIAAADLVIVAVPCSAIDNVIDLLRLAGAKRVVSAVVPWTGDDAEPAIGRDDSVAERFARALPGSHVAGALTTVAAATIRSVEAYNEAPTVFVVSDDAELKKSVQSFSESMGFDSIDAGPLYAARFTEAMAFLWTATAFKGGAGEMVAFRAVLPR